MAKHFLYFCFLNKFVNTNINIIILKLLLLNFYNILNIIQCQSILSTSSSSSSSSSSLNQIKFIKQTYGQNLATFAAKIGLPHFETNFTYFLVNFLSTFNSVLIIIIIIIIILEKI